jgi:hypothetical protein
MAQYNPFFERAGMALIQQTTPPKQALVIQSSLSQFGFNTTLLSSQSHITTQLKHLTPTELAKLRQTFKENMHPRFRETGTLNSEKLTKLINITATLLQTKTYLFWQNQEQLKDPLSQSS